MEAIERLTAWIRDYGDGKQPVFIADLQAVLAAAREAETLRAERDEYRGQLLRIAAHITPIRDADKGEQHVSDMYATMQKLDEIDDLVNSRVCDLECFVAQAEAERDAALKRVAELEARLNKMYCD